MLNKRNTPILSPTGQKVSSKMSRWISLDGKWFPAKERVGLKNNANEDIKIPKKRDEKGEVIEWEIVPPGADYIYEGPDRAALFELYLIDKSGAVNHLGVDFKTDPMFIKMTKDTGFASVKEYLAYMDYDEKKVKARFDELSKSVKPHDVIKWGKFQEMIAGGKDTSSSGKHVVGGFGVEQLNSASV